MGGGPRAPRADRRAREARDVRGQAGEEEPPELTRARIDLAVEREARGESPAATRPWAPLAERDEVEGGRVVRNERDGRGREQERGARSRRRWRRESVAETKMSSHAAAG